MPLRASGAALLVGLWILLAGCTDPTLPGNGDDDLPIQDTDSDGVPDDEDACPLDGTQWTDADGDGFCDEVSDACPDDPEQALDADFDGHCDELDDDCLNDPQQWTDADGDGFCDELDDDCPDDPDGFLDVDNDGLCYPADACPFDGLQWTDADGDGRCDEVDDECPGDPLMWHDANGDGICDINDDWDGDGIPDLEEVEYGADCAVSDPELVDSDNDGVPDNEDPYPRDEFFEFILFANENGTIDFVLSNRDGTFQAPVEVGLQYGGTANSAYRYRSFAVSDWDNNGKIDFLALADPDPANPGPLDLWFFWRYDTDTSFDQLLIGPTDVGFLGSPADYDNDELMDLMHMETARNGNYTDADMYFYRGTGDPFAATCAWSDQVPNTCLFTKSLAVDLQSWASGQWVLNYSRQAVDADGDGNRDLAIYNIRSGGNDRTPVYLLLGDGAGGFSSPGNALFTHNDNRSRSPANAIMFADFNGDTLGDVILGLDDDGDAGSAWIYPGSTATGSFDFDTGAAVEAFDLNPSNEAGSENPGPTSAARNFDVDFDGIQDVLVGWRYNAPWNGPSETVFLRGRGDGTFEAPVTIRDFPLGAGQTTNNGGMRFAIPQRICTRFPIR